MSHEAPVGGEFDILEIPDWPEGDSRMSKVKTLADNGETGEQRQRIRQIGGNIWLEFYDRTAGGEFRRVSLLLMESALKRCSWMTDDDIEAVKAAFEGGKT